MRLREFTTAAALRMFEIYADPEVTRFLARPQPPSTVDEVAQHLDDVITDYRRYGYGFWAV